MTDASNVFFERGQIAEDRRRNILVSFSGGRTSAFMAKFLKERYPNDNLLFVFANTGKEKEETLIFVNKCDKEFGLNLVWIEAKVNEKKGEGTTYKIVDFESASRNGEPFEAVLKKYGLPSKLYRHCTRELKEVPIHKYAKRIFEQKAFLKWINTNYSVICPYPRLQDYRLTTLYSRFTKTGNSDYITALGIRADEKHRLKSDPRKIYPLAEINVDEVFIRGWWKRQSFDLGLKDYEGNCDLCFLKSTRKKLTLIAEDPSIVNWWYEMEIKYNSQFQSKFDEIRNLSIMDLVELAKKPFRKAIDKEAQRESVPQLFEQEYDLEFDCFCKST